MEWKPKILSPINQRGQIEPHKLLLYRFSGQPQHTQDQLFENSFSALLLAWLLRLMALCAIQPRSKACNLNEKPLPVFPEGVV
jgi:hypothetical protein